MKKPSLHQALQPSALSLTGSRAARPLWSWPAIIALLGLVFMPLLGSGTAAPPDPFDAPICSDHAAQSDGSADGGRPAPHTDHATVCWFCLAHPGWLPATRPFLAPPRAVWQMAVGQPVPAGTLPRAFFLARHRSRAPPIRTV